VEPADRQRVGWCGRAYGIPVGLALKPVVHIFSSSEPPALNSRQDCFDSAHWQGLQHHGDIIMKKTYQKPTLDKSALLQKIAAAVTISGEIIIEP